MDGQRELRCKARGTRRQAEVKKEQSIKFEKVSHFPNNRVFEIVPVIL